MPTFTFSFSPENPFVPASSPVQTGAIAEAFRKSKGVERSFHPSHSVAFSGKDAVYYAASHYGIAPFGMTGPFGKMYTADFKILMLGCGLAPNSMLHAVEDWAGLPYIADAAATCASSFLHGISDGGVKYPHMPLFHRDFYRPPDEAEKAKYARLMKRRKALVKGKVLKADAYLMRAGELVDICMSELDRRPDLFLCDDEKCTNCFFNRYELKTWMKHGGTLWDQIWVGASKTNITPGIGVYSNQGWGRGEPCEGVHDDIYCRIIIFRDKTEYFALVSLEVCVIELDVSDRLKKAIMDKAGIAPGNIIICTTHTHCSPMVGAERIWPDSIDNGYVEFLAAKVSGCAYEAMKNLEPGFIASAGCGVDIGNINRRVRMKDGSVKEYIPCDETCPLPNGPASKEFSMIFFKNRSGELKAGIGHYACHPIFAPYVERKISADYPGVFSAVAENELGVGAVVAFIQGACGDQMPLKYSSSYAEAANAGKKLAFTFLLKSLDAKFKPFKHIALKSERHKIANADNETVTLIQCLAMNGGIIAFGSSELFYEFVEVFRKKLKSKKAILAGYIDALTYLPTKEDFKNSTYEIQLCEKALKARPGIGEEIVDSCVEICRKIIQKSDLASGYSSGH